MTVAGQIALVAVGGAFGAALRHAFNLYFARSSWPVSTLLVNVIGCLVVGFLVYWFTVRDITWWTQTGRLLLATGFCGAFTTMSALALETGELAKVSGVSTAAGFALGTLILSLLGLGAGAWVARALL